MVAALKTSGARQRSQERPAGWRIIDAWSLTMSRRHCAMCEYVGNASLRRLRRGPSHRSLLHATAQRSPLSYAIGITQAVGENAQMINGNTNVIAHIGYPTHAFKAPMIYNPYFEHAGINAVVVPMGCRPEHYASFLEALFQLENVGGALITMPHKLVTVGLLDDASPTVKIAGSCNAVRRTDDGRLVGDMFDGEGFVRGVRRKGCELVGSSVLVVGCGGVGSAIAASLAAAGIASIGLFDERNASALALGERLSAHYPALTVTTGSNDPARYDVVVNATPMGMNDGDTLPMDVSRIAPTTFVGEVVMKSEMTAFLKAVQARGCRFQVGLDMLFEQIPAYLEFFGFPTATPELLRSVAKLSY
jgi:shikimate dehydrogenase